MLTWFIHNRLAAFERKFEYDMTYARELLAADRRAFFAFARVQKLGNYRRDVPLPAYYGAKLTSTISEDCGPCAQLVTALALADGLPPEVVAAIARGELAALPDDAALGVRFARAALAHALEADELRDEIVQRWGRRALVSLSFAIVAARIYPTLKYALGYGKACQRVVVGGEQIVLREGA